MRAAEKHLSTGKVQNAIEEYCQIVENDPKDYNSLNMLGDLYVRVNERDEAINCFTLLADHYNRQGFAQKAIAMYNKVARLSPDSPEVSFKLAPLYQNKGLISEARSHYLIVADAFQKDGRRPEALEIWTRIAELDPHDTEIYLKVAEGYWQLDQKDESAKAFNEAGKRFLRRKQMESATAAFSRSLEINPNDKEAFEGNIQAQLTLGHYDDALDLVRNAVKDQPHNVETLRLFVKCLIESGDAAEAEKETIVLVEKDPSSYRLFVDIIELYLRKNETDSASRSLAIIFEHLWANGQFDDIQRLIDEILSRNPEQLTALRMLVTFHGYQQEEAKQVAALGRMSEAAHLNNVVEDEIFALSRLATLCPQDKEFSEKLANLHSAHPELSVSSMDFLPNSGIEYNAQTNNIPSFESFEKLSKDEEDGGFSYGATEIGSEEQFENVPVEAFVHLDETFVEPTEFESTSLSTDSTIENSVQPDLTESQALQLKTELESVDYYIENEYFDLAKETLQMLENQYGITGDIRDRKLKLPVSPEDEALISAQTVDSDISVAGSESGNETPVRNESPESDVSAVEVSDEATDETPVEFAFDSESVTSGSSFEVEAVSPTYNYEELTVAEEGDTEDRKDEASADDSEAFSGNSNVEESVSTTDEFEWQEIVEPKSDDNELKFNEQSLELASSEDFTQTEENTDLSANSDKEFDSMFENLAVENPTDEQVGNTVVEHNTDLFDEFRSDLGFTDNELPASSSDYETHYDFGTAYKGMGLLDESIKEFQDAVKYVKPDDGTRRHLQCCSLLGMCFMEKEMPRVAIMWFKRGMETTNLSEDELKAINYELAMAYEKDGDKTKAIEVFTEIYAFDVDYRNVSERLSNLQN